MEINSSVTSSTRSLTALTMMSTARARSRSSLPESHARACFGQQPVEPFRLSAGCPRDALRMTGARRAAPPTSSTPRPLGQAAIARSPSTTSLMWKRTCSLRGCRDLAPDIASGPHPEGGQYLSHLSTPEELLTAGQQEFEDTLAASDPASGEGIVEEASWKKASCWPSRTRTCSDASASASARRSSESSAAAGTAKALRRAHRVEERIDDLGEPRAGRMKPAGPCLALPEQVEEILGAGKGRRSTLGRDDAQQHQVQRGAQGSRAERTRTPSF